MSKYTDETRPKWHRPLTNHKTRERFSGARQGFPEPVVVVQHDGNLNRRQRRAQGRYRGFLEGAKKGAQTAPLLLRRSGSLAWSKKERAKLMERAERHSVSA